MNYSENVNRWQQFARSKGWRSIYPAPHEWIVIKLTGKECTPAFFWPSWALAILFAFPWSVGWAIFMHLTIWKDKSLFQIAVSSTACGVLFGIGIAALHVTQKRKYGLTTWEKFIDDEKSPSELA